MTASIVDFEEEIAHTYAQLELCVFWVEQFANLAPPEEAEQRLMQLVQVGKLRCKAELRCCEGHTIWDHDLSMLEQGRAYTCNDCRPPGSPAEEAYIRYEIADEWLASLKKKARRARRTPRR